MSGNLLPRPRRPYERQQQNNLFFAACKQEDKQMKEAKVSIRFYNDRQVRAVWDEGKAQWFFSVLDVIGAINEQDDYSKTRNYWKYLKTKLKKEGSEVVSATNQLKLLASDGKRYVTDTLDDSSCQVDAQPKGNGISRLADIQRQHH